MNWYKISKLNKISKHVSNKSHSCIYCKSNLIFKNFSRNSNHHFPWGINYLCSCGKSGLWTNSIRSEKEFMAIVFGNKTIKDMPYASGFCNDLYCPFCLSGINILYNGLSINNNNEPCIYVNQEKSMITINDYDLFIKKFNGKENLGRENWNILNYDKSYMGEKIKAKSIIKSVDVRGCSTLNHNIGIMNNGYEYEYGEGEYTPIYDMIKQNKNKIPQEMIREFKNVIEG